MEEATVLNLLPVCECGHVFKEIKINRKITTLGKFCAPVESRFDPSVCPNCKRFIREIHVPQDFSI